MKPDTLFKVLQLDSIIKKLTLEERILIHKFRNGRSEGLTINTINMYNWILKNKWKPPTIKYDQARLLYYETETGERRPIEELEKILTDIKF